MLIPEPKDPLNSVRIVGVDPGSAHLGLAVLDWVFGEPQARVVWAKTIHAVDPTHQNSHAEVCGNRDARMAILEAAWCDFLRIAVPTFACSETPFMQRKTLSAYESGVELQQMLRSNLFQIYPEKVLHGYNPIIVKAHVGVESKGTDKTHMYRAVSELYRNHTDIDLSTLDEHSIDAIAVVNIFVRHSLLSLNSLLPPKQKKPKKPRTGKRGKRRRK